MSFGPCSMSGISVTKTMGKSQILLLSSSKVDEYGYLEYAAADIKDFLDKNNVRNILFVPYALKDHDAYLEQVKPVLTKWGYNVTGIHQSENSAEAIKAAESIFIGGGNTFNLLKHLYDYKLLPLIRQRVIDDGMPYIGSSAGTNVATKGIYTSNDMPIVYPPSFDALKLVPFCINPHYLEPDVGSKHKGETRDERILQYQEMPDAVDVLGLREGSMLLVDCANITLKGICGARLFKRGNKNSQEIEVGTNLSYLLEDNN